MCVARGAARLCEQAPGNGPPTHFLLSVFPPGRARSEPHRACHSSETPRRRAGTSRNPAHSCLASRVNDAAKSVATIHPEMMWNGR